MRSILRAAGAVLAGFVSPACAAAPPVPLSPEPPPLPPAHITPVATKPPKPSEPAPPSADTDPAHSADRPRGLDEDLKRVETVVEIACALAEAPSGPIRAWLARWLTEHAHARAEALRTHTGGEAPERVDALIALGDSIDVFERPGKAEQTGVADTDAMVRALDRTRAPFASTSTSSTSQEVGSLTPEAIQAIVRASFTRFRDCYDRGLKRNASLSGRVKMKFVIERDGRVSSISDDGSTLPDPEVLRCIGTGFADLRFSAPRGGIVTVVYPIQFNPGD